MSYSYHANQYEGGYNNTRMRSWTIPKHRDFTAKLPQFREGSSFFIADDRGYLKPGVTRSKESPWGTFMGTWDMPHQIPQPYVNKTGRQSEAAKKLIEQVKASPLNHARNGFVDQSLFAHCVKAAAEESCQQLQPSPLPSPEPQPATRSPTIDDEEPPKLPSLDPCPGSQSVGGQRGGQLSSPPRVCPPRPVPQQYTQEGRREGPSASPRIREQYCPGVTGQRGAETERAAEKGQECKPPLIG